MDDKDHDYGITVCSSFAGELFITRSLLSISLMQII